MKRFLCLLLILSAVCARPVAAKTDDMTASEACIAMLKWEEGFSKYPYWDYAQWTIGYGTRCPEERLDEYRSNGISEQEANRLLQDHLNDLYQDLKRFADEHALSWTQNQFDALVLFSYNCGTGWTYEETGTFYCTIRDGATGNNLIRGFALWCSAGDEIKDYLLRRRLCEANLWLNGIYAQTPPETYSYVLYDANGGVTVPRSQGYDAALTSVPYPIPTYNGFVFEGWYTEKDGGVKVTVLDESVMGKTVYAHWTSSSQCPIVGRVNVREFLRVRKAPGLENPEVSRLKPNESVEILEQVAVDGMVWGRITGGWISMDYVLPDDIYTGRLAVTAKAKKVYVNEEIIAIRCVQNGVFLRA